MQNKLLKQITQNWKQRIKSRGFTIGEFCENSGLSLNTWNGCFRDDANPTIGLLNIIEIEIQKVEDNV